MKHILKTLSIIAILSFFVCVGWVLITADGMAFRWLVLSVLGLIFAAFGSLSWFAWKETKRRKAELQAAEIATKAIIERLTKNAINN